MHVALSIFLLTYVLIMVRLPGKLRIGRGVAALIGLTLMILLGVVSVTEAWRSIDFDVLFLLIGMMVLVVGLEYCGLFEVISKILVDRFRTRKALLAGIMGISALLAALVLNDAVVLLFTPIVIRTCAKIRADPIPYIVGMLMSANIGSVATAIGNPQNAYIVSFAGLGFIDFSLHLAPVALACMPVAYLIVYAVFRKRIEAEVETKVHKEEPAEIDITRLRFIIFVMVAMFAGFIISSFVGVPLYVPAVCAAAVAVIVVLSKDRTRGPWVVKRVDWSIIAFFIGLFVVMEGVSVSGLLGEISALFPGFGPGETPTILSLSLFSLVLSNLVSNVPAVMLLSNLMPPDPEILWYVLAGASTLGGNATFLGSAANVIVAESAERYGVEIDLIRLMAIGIPMAAVTTGLLILMLSLF